MIVMSGLENFS